MSLDMCLFLIGIILILVDIFFVSDVPTFIAILLFCFLFYRQLHFGMLINIIITIAFFFVILVVYIFLWRKICKRLVDNWFAKDVYKAGVSSFPGKKGIVKVIDGKKYAQIDGDLYAFLNESSLPENSSFTVKEVKNGMIVTED